VPCPTIKIPRQEKKGGVNLPRHRVEHCIAHKTGSNTYPGRKKRRRNLPRYRVEPYSARKTGCSTCPGRKKKEE